MGSFYWMGNFLVSSEESIQYNSALHEDTFREHGHHYKMHIDNDL